VTVRDQVAERVSDWATGRMTCEIAAECDFPPLDKFDATAIASKVEPPQPNLTQRNQTLARDPRRVVPSVVPSC
jgi:hypothetical protein